MLVAAVTMVVETSVVEVVIVEIADYNVEVADYVIVDIAVANGKPVEDFVCHLHIDFSPDY